MDPTQYLHIQKQLLTNEKDKRPIIRLGKWFKDTMQCHALYEWIQPIKKSRPQIFVLAVCGSCAWVSPYILMHALSNEYKYVLKTSCSNQLQGIASARHETTKETISPITITHMYFLLWAINKACLIEQIQSYIVFVVFLTPLLNRRTSGEILHQNGSVVWTECIGYIHASEQSNY